MTEDEFDDAALERLDELERAEARLLDEDEVFDEDAAMCGCGHNGAAHAGPAWGYACCIQGCACRGFQG